jgi:hypothetical protein
MARYVFFAAELPATVEVRAAVNTARQFGRVIKYAAGTMLLEVEPARLRQLAAALPGWRHTVERMGYRLPERTPRMWRGTRGEPTDRSRGK